MIITFVACIHQNIHNQHPREMNSKLITPRLLIISGIILFASLMRLVPHFPNFTPVAAIALFGGAYLGRKPVALIVPLLALFISDIFLGFHNMMIPVYIGFAMIVLLGSLMRNRVRVPYIIGGSLAGSLIFFLITNFAVWAFTPYYPPTIQGLITSYTMAIPFFHAGLLGDLFYNTVFFGGFYLVRQYYPSLKLA